MMLNKFLQISLIISLKEYRFVYHSDLKSSCGIRVRYPYVKSKILEILLEISSTIVAI